MRKIKREVYDKVDGEKRRKKKEQERRIEVRKTK